MRKLKATPAVDATVYFSDIPAFLYYALPGQLTAKKNQKP